jgi:hypothetical protein
MQQEEQQAPAPKTGSAGRTAFAVVAGATIGSISARTLIGVASAITQKNPAQLNPFNNKIGCVGWVAASAVATFGAWQAYKLAQDASHKPGERVADALNKSSEVQSWDPQQQMEYSAYNFASEPSRMKAELLAAGGKAITGAVVGKYAGNMAAAILAGNNKTLAGAIKVGSVALGAFMGGQSGIDDIQRRTQRDGNKVMSYAERVIASRMAPAEVSAYR